jgi:hypothetical protein
LLEVEDVHLEATNPAAHGEHGACEVFGSLVILGFSSDQAQGVPAGSNLPCLDLGLTHSATHIKPSGAKVEGHPVMTDRLLVSHASDCHISGDGRELCCMHPGVFS